MPGPTFCDGDIVELRTIEEEDIEFLQQLINDSRVRTSLAAVEPKNREQERDWVGSLGDDDSVHLLICADGERVGCISLKPPNEIWGVVEVGYMIAPEQWGNGYATDALATLCGYAFNERRLNKVYAHCFTTNPASRRVLEKVGFEEEGLLREEAFIDGDHVDVHRYGLLANEWQNA
ncbi:GNAT family N-acetyltransferase [Halocatena marina]|uniref:GNAT family N-acetyltransferase n=1 Tax=Halocatena marina TaxID=2934937 RepID=UPI00200E5AF4|nr:GNAT family protein [Halocatena marina]